MESPGSPLSEHSDEEFREENNDWDTRSTAHASPSPSGMDAPRPAKRQKTRTSAFEREAQNGLLFFESSHFPPAPGPDEDLSSDTDGSVPGSPHMGPIAALPGDDEEGAGRGEQVRECKWEGCQQDCGNMDLLVQHLHDEHIHARQKKYSCEWLECSRKGISHASGYALRAHMRSHTREKPFYCTLPECDRSFTRSDALAKHMRTVHETEALRPSDPVPKHHSSALQTVANKSQRLKLTFKNSSSAPNGSASEIGSLVGGGKSGSGNGNGATSDWPVTGRIDEEYETNNVVFTPAAEGEGPNARKQFPNDVHFSPAELEMPAPQLCALLERELRWGVEDRENLRSEIEALEKRRRREWLGKELLLHNVMEAEVARLERTIANVERGKPTGAEEVQREGEGEGKGGGAMAGVKKGGKRDVKSEERAMVRKMRGDLRGADTWRLSGDEVPWWRSNGEKTNGVE